MACIILPCDAPAGGDDAAGEQKRARLVSGSMVFVIGGSLGLSDAVVRRANEKLSFSAMTFPHQMMRMILCEQIAGVFAE